MIMKKIYVVLFMLGTLFLSAQSIFDAYANNEEVSYVSISPKMFQMLGKMSVSSSDPEAAEFLKMVPGILCDAAKDALEGLRKVLQT